MVIFYFFFINNPPKDLDQDILAERLKSARKEKQLTQKELANIANVSQISISNYENPSKSSANPSLKTVYSLALALDVSLDWLCGLTPEPNARTYTIDTKTFLYSFVEFLNRVDFCPNDEKSDSYDHEKIKATFEFNIKNNNKNIYSFIKEYTSLFSAYKEGHINRQTYYVSLEGIINMYAQLSLDRLFLKNKFSSPIDE